MDIIKELTGLINVPILLVGLVIGYMIKHIVSDEAIQNKYIPVINVIVGVILGIVIAPLNTGMTAEAIVLSAVGGAVSCAASSGFYDAFKAFLESPKGQ